MKTLQVKKVCRPLLFLLCLAVGVFAIAGAAVTAKEEERASMWELVGNHNVDHSVRIKLGGKLRAKRTSEKSII